MDALIVETEAYKHTRDCHDCRRNLPCEYATRHYYGGGLFEVTDPGRYPAPTRA